MFDIGWTELLVIGVVALIVVGPKDLPGMFRTLGRFTAKARSMAREFSRAMEEAADESGVGDVAKDLKSMTSAKNLGLNSIKDAATRFEDWDPLKKNTDSNIGPETAKLGEERAAAAKKIRDAAAEKASSRAAAKAKSEKKSNKSVTKKPTAKKSATKKPTAKKPAAKKSSVKRPTPKQAKTRVPKKAATQKVAATKATKKKPAKGPAE